MRIYRLEREGFGPFGVYMPSPHNTKVTELIRSVDWSTKNLSNPGFKKGDVEHNFIYGCTSMESLTDYFTQPIIDKLIEYGYQVMEVNVPKRACRFAADEGKIEVAFPKYHRDIKYARVDV